jgi:hypothetical protein
VLFLNLCGSRGIVDVRTSLWFVVNSLRETRTPNHRSLRMPDYRATQDDSDTIGCKYHPVSCFLNSILCYALCTR